MPYWGSLGEGGAAGLPIENLRGKGRAILHGEQEFIYHGGDWPHVGDTLVGEGSISDVYEKEKSSGGKLEFYVTETTWKNERTGKPGRDHEVHARDQLHGPTPPIPSRSRSSSWATRAQELADRAEIHDVDRPLRLGDRHQGLGAARHVLHRRRRGRLLVEPRRQGRTRTSRSGRGSRRCCRRSPSRST